MSGEFKSLADSDTEIALIIGGELLLARQRNGWSQSFVAKKVGLSCGSSIQRFEAGERCPSLCMTLKLMKALDVPTDRIFPRLLRVEGIDSLIPMAENRQQQRAS